jgi:putative endonuclease
MLLTAIVHGPPKRIVYVIRSDVDPSRHYTGITNDLPLRLSWHNSGRCGHTNADRPWSLVVTLEFPTEQEAVRFEKYLKTGSGRAFSKRHFGSVKRQRRRDVRSEAR